MLLFKHPALQKMQVSNEKRYYNAVFFKIGYKFPKVYAPFFSGENHADTNDSCLE